MGHVFGHFWPYSGLKVSILALIREDMRFYLKSSLKRFSARSRKWRYYSSAQGGHFRPPRGVHPPEDPKSPFWPKMAFWGSQGDPSMGLLDHGCSEDSQDSIVIPQLSLCVLIAELVLELVSTRCVGFHTELIGVRMSFGDKLLLKFFPKLSLRVI